MSISLSHTHFPSLSSSPSHPLLALHSTFLSNNGSSILLRLSLAYLEGQLLFQDNIANRGAAISVLDRSRVRPEHLVL